VDLFITIGMIWIGSILFSAMMLIKLCLVVLFRREDSIPFNLHPCLESAESEAQHLRLITETFISKLLPSSFVANTFVRNLLREIFACKGM